MWMSPGWLLGRRLFIFFRPAVVCREGLVATEPMLRSCKLNRRLLRPWRRAATGNGLPPRGRPAAPGRFWQCADPGRQGGDRSDHDPGEKSAAAALTPQPTHRPPPDPTAT